MQAAPADPLEALRESGVPRFEARPIQNLRPAAGVRHDARFAQLPQRHAHACPPHSQHVRQEFLRQVHVSAFHSVLAHQQPSRQSLFGIV